MRNPDAFDFVTPGWKQPGGAYVRTVDHRISDVDDLFAEYKAAFEFPDYFGRNWNAFYDCLCDFSWTDTRHIVVVHNGFPSIPFPDVLAYLECLADAVVDWRERPGHCSMRVVFPVEVRERVIETLAMPAPWALPPN